MGIPINPCNDPNLPAPVTGGSRTVENDAVFGIHCAEGNGVRGVSNSGVGAVGSTQSNAQSGIFGFNGGHGTVPEGLNRPAGNGVWGHTTVEKGSGVTGSVNPGLTQAAGVTGIGLLAGQFFGNVNVTGSITVGQDVVVSGDVRLPQRDIAELFPARTERDLVPGSVMVIDPEGKLIASTEAYDTRVVGILSSGGDRRPGMILGTDLLEDAASIALVGTTYCLADASEAPILPGDLLVSGRRKGYAMKAIDPFRRIGAIIGKSLERLEVGEGLVRVIVALQ